MQKIYILFALIWIFQCGYSQEGFVKKFDDGAEKDIAEFWDVVIDNDTIVLYGGAFDSTGVQGIKFMKLDTFGNILSENIIVDTARTLTITTWRKKIIKTANGGYLVVGSSKLEPYLLKVHHDLSLDFIEFYPSADSKGGGHTVVETIDGFLLAGSENLDTMQNRLFVIKTDKQGKQIWRKNPVNTPANVFEMSAYDANTFVLGATYAIPGQNSSVLICIDSIGEMKWVKQSDYVFDQGPVLDFELLADSSWIITSGTWEDSPFGGKVMRLMVIRYDTDFNVLWRWTDDRPSNFHQFTDLERTPDGNFIASGWKVTGVVKGDLKGIHYKFTPEGEPLWMRLDSVYPDSIVGYRGMHVEGTAILSSGSIISVGWAEKTEPHGNYGFVMKITPGGCVEETDNCWPAVATSDLVVESESLVVYPNPASDYITFSRKGEAWKPKSELVIMDIYGRVVRHVSPQGGDYRMDVSGLNSGLYFYRYLVEGGIVDSGKFLVVRLR